MAAGQRVKPLDVPIVRGARQVVAEEQDPISGESLWWEAHLNFQNQRARCVYLRA